ncbi:MAG TPA: prolipoprotein diacylglyceryl transferase [Gemmatimonadales bacterium]|nr:prolipoprotein diacylglyceryl transferase [Gemmatimonadales bacterium]
MTIYPLTFQLGPLAITGYGIMMMVAFLMAGWAIQLDLRARGMREEYAADIVFAAVIGGIVGAKIWYVLLTQDWDALFRRGGFVWYGGFLGGVAGVLATGVWRRVPARWTMELTAAPLALGYALGRVGCFLVNDDYGIPSTLPWAVKFPEGLPPTTVANLQQMHVTFPPDANPLQLVAVHPTQLYETALMLLAFAWLWKLRNHRHAVGWRFGLYLVLAGTERFLVEIVRAKDDRLLGPFSLAQATSTLLVLAGVWLMVRLREPEPAPLAAPVLTETTAAAGPARPR